MHGSRWAYIGNCIQGQRSRLRGYQMHCRVVICMSIGLLGFLPRDAMLSVVYAVILCPSACVCVCVSVTLRYCIKTAKRRITQITPHDRSGTLVYTDKRVARSLCHSRASCIIYCWYKWWWWWCSLSLVVCNIVAFNRTKDGRQIAVQKAFHLTSP